MLKKIFIIYEDAVRNDGSVQMRGFQIFEKIKKYFEIYILSLSEVLALAPKHSILLFVKPKLYHLHKSLLETNCTIYDVLDTVDRLEDPFLKNVTCGLFCTKKIQSEFSNKFKCPSLSTTIYHHWDPRIPTDNVTKSAKLIGYFGEREKLHFYEGIEKDMDLHFSPFVSYRDKIKNYECHYIIKPSFRIRNLEPLTKIATAAQVGSPVIAPWDHSVELLGISYPYYVESNLANISQVIERVQRTYDKAEWKEACAIMDDIRVRCSVDSVALEYRHMFLSLMEKNIL